MTNRNTENSSVALSSRGFEYGVKHMLSPYQGPLVEVLGFLLTDLSSEKLYELIQLGAVYLNHKRILLPESPVKRGDYIRTHTLPRRFDLSDYKWDQHILFSNEEYLVVSKPAGIPCHPSVDNYHENLLKGLERHLQRQLFITHRLDVPTEGLIVLAKTTRFQKAFNSALQADLINKYYVTLTTNSIPLGLHVHYMKPDIRAPKKISTFPEDTNWKECRLQVISCRPDQNHRFWESQIHLLTGRTHQIRAQLAALGSPILGDRMYGPETRYHPNKDVIALRSQKISWDFAEKVPGIDQNFLFELPESTGTLGDDKSWHLFKP